MFEKFAEDVNRRYQEKLAEMSGSLVLDDMSKAYMDYLSKSEKGLPSFTIHSFGGAEPSFDDISEIISKEIQSMAMKDEAWKKMYSEKLLDSMSTSRPTNIMGSLISKLKSATDTLFKKPALKAVNKIKNLF